MYDFFLVWLFFMPFFGVILFCAILEKSINNRMASKIKVDVYYWYLFTQMENL